MHAIRFAFAVIIAAALPLLWVSPAAAQPSGAPAAGPIYPNAQQPPALAEASERPQYASVPGPETNRLIQGAGREWREMRNSTLSTAAGWIVALAFAILALVYLVKGPVRLHGPETGERLPRFNALERSTHAVMATSFVLLALTGVVILWGKHLVLPWLGYSAFATFTAGCKLVHNFVGPVFVVSIVVGFLVYLRHNIPRAHDFAWLARAGGMFSGREMPSGKFNGGEKAWFWLGLAGLGTVLSVTGLILDFPNWSQGREAMQWANVLHLGAAALFIALGMGHAYMGTIGVEGAWRAMRDGDVDAAWARQHHRLWYEEMMGAEAETRPAPTPVSPARRRPVPVA
jgi:formate dehydrogenase subunit gamma